MYKNILIAVLLVLNFTNVTASSSEERFIIYGDSRNKKESYQIKRQLIDEYEDLVKGLDKEDYSQAIEDNLVCEDATYKNHTLTVIVGDGKGEVLRGRLKADYCKIEKEEIQTQFFFKKIWQSATS